MVGQKLNWLIYKYYSDEWRNWRPYDINHRYTVTRNEGDPNVNFNGNIQHQPSEQSTVIQTAEEKVTYVNLDNTQLPDGTTELLALGPGYAVSPNLSKKNKEQFIKEICDRIADAAIRMRWNNHFKDRPSAQTLDQYFKSISPFDKKYTKPPPTDDLDLENRLVQFSDTVRNIVSNTSVTQNITTDQRKLLNQLRESQDIQLSIADKTSEFVVMKKEDHIRATKLHFDCPAYRKIDMPTAEKEVTKYIQKLTKSMEDTIN